MTDIDTQIGCIKWFDTKKGYGFLTNTSNKEDVFVHFSSIYSEEEVYKMVYEGEYVSYSHKTDEKGRLVTEKVTGVGGGKLLCENDFFKRLNSNLRKSRNIA